MAALSSLAIIGLSVAAAGTVLNYSQQKKSQRLQEKAAGEQRKANAQQSALQDQQSAQERRQQVREERVKRAQIMNQAALTGTGGSSGELGATAGMSSQLGSNMGFNQSMILGGQQISGFMQNSANYQTQAQSASNRGQMFGQIGGLGSSLFAQAGGWKTIFSK